MSVGEIVIHQEVNLRDLRKSLKEIVKYVLESGDREFPSVFLEGPPGVGKSYVVREIANKFRIDFIDLRLATIDSVDLRGFPYPNIKVGASVWIPPAFLPKAGKGILFLDEFNLADVQVQNAAYQLVLDKRLGDYVLPDGWYIIAAGNRREDSFAVNEMSDPLISRFIHFVVKPDLDIWIEDFAIPKRIDERIIGFLKYRPEFFFKIDPARREKPYPCPRTWEFANKLLKVFTNKPEVIASAVGSVATSEFLGYLEVYKILPDIEKALKTGEIEFPERNETSIWYAMSTALGMRASDLEQVNNVLKIVLQMKKEGFAIYGSYVLTLLGARKNVQNLIFRSKFYDSVLEQYI